MCWVFRLSLP